MFQNEEINLHQTALNIKKQIDQIRTSLQSIITHNDKKKIQDSKEIQVD